MIGHKDPQGAQTQVVENLGETDRDSAYAFYLFKANPHLNDVRKLLDITLPIPLLQ